MLLVGMGARGGVGRYEQLLLGSLDLIAESAHIDVRSIWLDEHPRYLTSRFGAAPSARGSSSRLGLKYVRLLASWRPSVVWFSHVHLARLSATRIRAVTPHVVMCHGAEVWSRRDALCRRALAQAAIVVTNSSDTAAAVAVSQGVSHDKIRISPLAVDDFWLSEGMRPHATSDRSSERPYTMLTVARLEAGARDKGVDDVIRTLPSVQASLGSVQYVIVGDGDDVPYLEDVAIRAGVRDIVVFRPNLSDHALADAYRQADQFVLPSRREGFGLAFAEAMAFGLPVIALAARAASDVVAHGVTGILIEEVSELDGAIIRLARDPQYSAALGRAGQRAVAGDYSLAAFAERTRSILVEALPT